MHRRSVRAFLAGVLMLIALPVFASQASAAYNVTSPPTFTFVLDESTPQVDDFPGQKDLNAQAVATVPGTPVQLWTAVKWDDVDFSGGNTGDSCALFDTDSDLKANYAVCLVIGGAPAVQDAVNSPRTYSCSDKSATKCTSKSSVIGNGETACDVKTSAETFTAQHGTTPGDTLGYCRIDTGVLTGATAPDLINTCSYPSSSPTSDPSDCVLIPRDAFIRVKKVTNVATQDTFDFTLTPAGGQTTTPTAFDNLAGGTGLGTTSAYVGIRSTVYSLAEIVPSTWSLTGATCANTTGTADNLGTFNAQTSAIGGIDAKPDGQITCTFNDSLRTGGLNVHKYIDINENGTEEAASETAFGLTSLIAGDLTGWSFTVIKDGNELCTGTTNPAGVLETCGTTNLSALTPGTYSVRENNNGKTIGSSGASVFNTDPGTAPAALPVSDTSVTVAANGTAIANFGNTCYNTATFEVTGAGDATGLFARYWTGNDPSVFTDVNMTADAQTPTTWRASAGGFRKDTVVHWQFGLNADKTQRVTGTDVTLPGYPACGATQSSAFGAATLAGTKYNDADNSGTKEQSEGGLAGITVQLKDGADVIDTEITDATGAFSFGSVAPGSYTIHEMTPTGWQQTEPASDADISVVVPVGASGTINTYGQGTPIRFGNTPLSSIDVTFNSLGQLRDATGADTGPATKATSIACDHNGTSLGAASLNDNTHTQGGRRATSPP